MSIRPSSGYTPAHGTQSSPRVRDRAESQQPQRKAASVSQEQAARPAPGGRIESLDGLRTLAILSVVLYHLGLSWFPSGHMGVVMFLVLTGYLVTSSLVRSLERRGAVGLKDFWLKRFKRIWPPMAIMIVVVLAICVGVNHILLTKARPDVFPSLLFFLNWSYIASGSSYFANIGGPSPLTHLWYLGIDAQMCVVLPLLVMLLMGKLKLDRAKVRWVFVGLAVVSAVLMGVLYDPLSDPSRVYYGTDTRAFAVFLGAALALAWPLGGRPLVAAGLLQNVSAGVGSRGYSREAYVQTMRSTPTLLVQVASIVALVALVAIMALVPASSSFFYYGGMVLVVVLTIVLMAGLLCDGSVVNTVFSLKPVVWVGQRSYGIYLWHFPIIQLLGAGTAASAWWMQLIAVAISVVAGHLTYIAIERPVANGDTARLFARIREQGVGSALAGAVDKVKVAVPAVCCALVGVVAIVGSIVVPPETLVPEDAIVSTGVGAGVAVDIASLDPATLKGGTVGTDSTSQNAQGSAQDASGQGGEQAVEELVPVEQSVDLATAAAGIPDGPIIVHEPAKYAGTSIVTPLLIGDSVPGDTDFPAFFPEGFSDCYIGRFPSQALEVLHGYIDQGVVGDIVVLASFSNTTAYPDDLERLVEAAGPDRQVFLVGTVNGDGFADEACTYMIECADAHENVHYVDWYAEVAGHEDEYLWADQTHLRPEGAVAYLTMIAHAIAPYVVAEGGWVEPAYVESEDW